MPVNLPQTPAIQNDSGSPRLVLRADIGFQRLEETGRRGWVAHDPLANQFYSLSDHERDLLARCDGNHDVAEILADFTARHPDLHLTADQLVAFLASAVQKGLLVRRGVSTPSTSPMVFINSDPVTVISRTDAAIWAADPGVPRRAGGVGRDRRDDSSGRDRPGDSRRDPLVHSAGSGDAVDHAGGHKSDA
ncbi:MAG: hypothetical protein NT069_30915 [Planctomycetota bacterium]|nr:hypothetical protein [Planctomycetota bacterium]